MSGCIQHLSISHSPVFLVNSCLDRFSAPPPEGRTLYPEVTGSVCPPGGEDPLSRSYRVSLPSSLTVIHSSASVYSTRPRVSVYGTGAPTVELSGFSRERGYARCWGSPEGIPILSGSDQAVDLPAALNSYTLQPAIPSAGGAVTSPSPHRPWGQYRNLHLFCHRPRRSAEP